MKKLLYLLSVVVMFAMTACSDKEDEPSVISVPAEISLNVGDSYDIKTTPSLNWTSEIPLIASVNDDGRVLGLLDGETLLKASYNSKNYSISVKVSATDNSINLPCLAFGKDKDYIQSVDKRERYMYSTDDELILWGEDGSVVDNVRYVFENGKMTGAILVSHFANLDKVKAFLSQRFATTKNSDSAIEMISPKGDVVLRITTTTSSKIAIGNYKTKKFIMVSFVGETK